MRRRDEPYFPVENWESSKGATIREEFIKAAFQGFLSNPQLTDTCKRASATLKMDEVEFIGKAAIEQADALLDALEGEKK